MPTASDSTRRSGNTKLKSGQHRPMVIYTHRGVGIASGVHGVLMIDFNLFNESVCNTNALCTPKASYLRRAKRHAPGVHRAIYKHRF